MDRSRRKFIGFISVLGAASLSGISLIASEGFAANGVYVDHSHVSNDAFDPDGWL